jgi:cyclophilin family peptidyl-prolyl cis-trans isomerase
VTLATQRVEPARVPGTLARRSRRAVALLAAATIIVIAGCTTSSAGATTPPDPDLSGCPTSEPAPLAAGTTRTVTISTGQGDLVLRIQADLSPIAAGNFVALAECGWYDGVVFHRVVPEFVIQGGDGQFGRVPIDSSQVGRGGPGYTITDEPVTAPYGRGVVAMARTSAPNSVGSQFFIVLDDSAAAALASYNTYQIIGSVTAGMEVADAIAAAADRELPSNPVMMTAVTVATP